MTVIGQNIGKNAGFRKDFHQVRPICKHACTKRLKLDVSTGLSHPLGNFWKDREEIIKIIVNNINAIKTFKIPLPAAGFKKPKKDKLRDLDFKTIIDIA